MDLSLASRAFPGFDHLYLMDEGPSGLRAETDWPGGPSGTDNRLTWLGLTRGEVRPPAPIGFTYAMGRRTPGDVVWTTNVFPFAVHRRVIDVLLDNRLTGWATYPVELYGTEGQRFSDYVGFSIAGRCGPVDGSRSMETSEQMPGGVSPRWLGLYFDEESWDGSDFFMTTDQRGWEFVTEEVARVFRQAKVKGFDFEAMSEVKLAFIPG